MHNMTEYTDFTYLFFPTEKLVVDTLVLIGVIIYKFVNMNMNTNRMIIVDYKLLT